MSGKVLKQPISRLKISNDAKTKLEAFYPKCNMGVASHRLGGSPNLLYKPMR